MIGKGWRAVGARLSKYEHYEITSKAYKMKLYTFINNQLRLSSISHTCALKQDATHFDKNQAQNNIAK